jgi:cell division transport system permease protein
VKNTTSTAVALLDEAFSGLWRARRMTFLSVALITVSVFLVGVFFLVAENLKGVVETVRDETVVTVFLKTSAGEAERTAVTKVAEDSRLVSRVRHVTAEDARKRFASSWKSLAAAAASLPVNPFPESLELDLTKEALGSAARPGLLGNLAAQKGVEEVQFDVEWIRRLRGIVAVVRSGGIALGFLLALGAAFTIANVVRLTILLHRDEIEILRLVGAPEILIRGPFVIGGLVQGLLGGAAAVALLALAFHSLLKYVAATHNALLGVFVIRFVSAPVALELVLGGLIAGILGGAVAVRRNLES